MKALSATFLSLLLLSGAASAAKPASPSPLIGSWAVDVSRLPMPPDARPKSVTITFGTADKDKWTTQVDIVDAGGEKRHAEGSVPLDGTPSPVQGNLEADTSAVNMPVPNVLIMQLAKGGVPASTRVYSAAADGKSMVETVAHFEKDGRPVLRKNYFTRIR